MRKLITATFLIFISISIFSQSASLPIKEWNSVNQSPFVFYITGDGGFNSFSTDLCTAINKSGFAISSLNAKSYFWEKKSPEKTATELAAYIEKKISVSTNRQFILVGYSFGADVMPFIINHFPESLRNDLLSVLLLSPSTSTDFEIHLWDMFGTNKQRSMDVVAAINQLTVKKVVTLFGNDESDFPVNDIRLKNYRNEILPGGHHFEGNTNELAKVMIKYFK